MLVTVEGIDGSGKSTLGVRVAKALRAEGLRVKQTEEPTATWLGEAVRRGIREDTDPLGLAFLFMADRADHVRRIREWEAQGYLVLSDRYADSTIAYQAVALADVVDDPLDYLRELQWRFFPKPQATLWLDADPETAIGRIQGRTHHERFERVSFLQGVRSNYSALADDEPERWTRLDADRKAAEVAAAAVEAVLARVAPKNASR